MAGWLDGWMVGWMDGWMYGWLDGWMVGWTDGWMVDTILVAKKSKALPLIYPLKILRVNAPPDR